jgi:hypothetical protein
MKLDRICKHCCIVLTALLASATAAQAATAPDANYPSKPLRMILPFGAGGSTDIIGRIFAQAFSEALGQTVVIDNRPGAAGIIGTETVARAAPDGYTLLTYGINQAITPALHNKLPYDHLRDFALVSLYATMPNILCITPKLPVANVGEFVKFLKASPGKHKYASSGIGASPHLTMEYFKSVTGVDIIHVQSVGAGLCRHNQRRDPGVLLQSSGTIAPREGRAPARARGDLGQARTAGPRSADGHGIGHSELRSDGLAGLRAAQGHPAAHHRERPCGDDESARAAGAPEALLRERRGRRARDTGAVHEVRRGRNREVEESRRGVRRQARTIKPGTDHGFAKK